MLRVFGFLAVLWPLMAVADGHGDTPFHLTIGYGENDQSGHFQFINNVDLAKSEQQTQLALIGLHLNPNLSLEVGGVHFGTAQMRATALVAGRLVGHEVILASDARLSHRAWGSMVGIRYLVPLTSGYIAAASAYGYVRGGILGWSRQLQLIGDGRLDEQITSERLTLKESERDTYTGGGIYVVLHREHAAQTGLAFDYTVYELGSSKVAGLTLHLVFDL